MIRDVYAHSLAGQTTDFWEPLHAHLQLVSRLAAENASYFGFSNLAGVAGILHDIGKTSFQFQSYIRGNAPSGGDHATAGAREALQAYGELRGRILALMIAGHHSGLADPDTLEARLASDLPPYDGWQAHAGQLPAPATLAQSGTRSGVGRSKAFSLCFLIRMLFSCLVDADFIATETFVQGRLAPRGLTTELATLNGRLRSHLLTIRDTARPLNALRAEVLDHAVGKAGITPGWFTLTVPTGGGKTLASLAFALEHAVRHGKRRVVVVIPFTAIIEQTAEVYRRALGDHDAVLEHHASFDWEQAAWSRGGGEDEQDGQGRLRRAAENWDAPIIVTTAVQFFESQFANRTSRCRKLHNLANAVIVLDEAQATPPGLLLPCMEALDELRRGYGASIVLCTATQPAWRTQDGALTFPRPDGTVVNLGLTIGDERELAPRPQALYAALRRVRVEVLPGLTSDAEVAEAFEHAPQLLCIVNSRAHARDVYERIKNLEGAAYLTTLMCPAHRRSELSSLKGRLKRGEPVRLVATSLIEAGVDISFPEVWRASTGLDAIAQAAGRCNREGELAPVLGRVVVFTPAEAKPPRALFAFQQAAAPILRDAPEPLGLDALGDYFRLLYASRGEAALDVVEVVGAKGIMAAIEGNKTGLCFPFASIADAFRMIDDRMQPIIVPWEGLEVVLDAYKQGRRSMRQTLRALQQFTVGIPERTRAEWLARGDLVPLSTEFGTTLLRLNNDALYVKPTGVDLSDGAYRRAEENNW